MAMELANEKLTIECLFSAEKGFWYRCETHLKVVGVVHVLALDAVAGADGPVLVVDGGAAEVPGKAEGDVLEAELVRQLPRSDLTSSDDLVETAAEGGLPGGGGCERRALENGVVSLLL